MRSKSPGMRRNSLWRSSGKSSDTESWCMPASFSLRNFSGVSVEQLLTTIIQGRPPSWVIASTIS